MDSREQRIRDRAHRLWESEGRPEDQEKRHWEAAEQAIDEEERAASTKPDSSVLAPGDDKSTGQEPLVGSAAPSAEGTSAERAPRRTSRRRNSAAPQTPHGALAQELSRRGDRASGNT